MQRWMIAGLLALVCTILHLWIFMTGIGESIEYFGLDTWFNLRGRLKTPSEVAVVAIDEPSYLALGVSLNDRWPRKFHAQLIEKLAELGAKRVAFDVLFSEPDSDKSADQALVTAMGKIPTVLGLGLVQTSKGGSALTVVEKPAPDLASAASALGLVEAIEDRGLVRHFYKGAGGVTEGLQTLAEAAADIAADDEELPGARDLVNYYGPPGTVVSLSIDDVLHGSAEALKKKIEGRIVFVGLRLKTEFGAAQKDTFDSPFIGMPRMFGVEIHATSAANLISKSWIKRSSRSFEGLILSVLTFVLTFCIFGLRPQWGALITFGFIITWGVTSYLAFNNLHFIPGATLCLMFLPLTFLGSTLYYYLMSWASQKQSRRVFEYYLSKEMADEVAKNPQSVALGGQGAYATAMFTDIEKFTSITESMLPEQVSDMLNSYFTEVMEVIFTTQGTLIKFIGDAVFALWGAPIKIPDHAAKACKAALEIQREVDKFNASKRFPPLITRIGIHTGPMVVGNLGSKRRFDFTAIGDSINLAARLEGVNKFLGTSIIISEQVVKELKNSYPTILLGNMQVAGKNEVIGLYTILETPLPEADREKWLTALREFRMRRWQEAERLFNEIKTSVSFLQTACELYIDEISQYRIAEPPSAWEGGISFKIK